MERNWDIIDNCNLLIQKILRKARKGTRVIYITGNHDDFLRRFGGDFSFGDIEVMYETIHISPNGKRYLSLVKK